MQYKLLLPNITPCAQVIKEQIARQRKERLMKPYASWSQPVYLCPPRQAQRRNVERVGIDGSKVVDTEHPLTMGLFALQPTKMVLGLSHHYHYYYAGTGLHDYK